MLKKIFQKKYFFIFLFFVLMPCFSFADAIFYEKCMIENNENKPYCENEFRKKKVCEYGPNSTECSTESPLLNNIDKQEKINNDLAKAQSDYDKKKAEKALNDKINVNLRNLGPGSDCEIIADSINFIDDASRTNFETLCDSEMLDIKSEEYSTTRTPISNDLGKSENSKNITDKLKEICERDSEGVANYDGGICVKKNNKGETIGTIGNSEAISGFDAFFQYVQKIVDWVIRIAYLLAVISIFVSGFKLLTANGDVAKLNSAKTNFFYIILGIFFITAAWLIVEFVIGLFIDENKIEEYKFIENNRQSKVEEIKMEEDIWL